MIPVGGLDFYRVIVPTSLTPAVSTRTVPNRYQSVYTSLFSFILTPQPRTKVFHQLYRVFSSCVYIFHSLFFLGVT